MLFTHERMKARKVTFLRLELKRHFRKVKNYSGKSNFPRMDAVITFYNWPNSFKIAVIKALSMLS